MKKGIVLPFLLLLASVALVLGALFLLDNKPKTIDQQSTPQASPSPTVETVYTDEGSANWKTIENSNFSISYPPNWILFNNSFYKPDGLIRFHSRDYATDGGRPNIIKGFRVALDARYGCINKNSEHYDTIKIEEINLNGKPAQLIETNYDDLFYTVATQDMCLSMSVPSSEIFSNNKKDLLKSASSFKLKAKFCGGIVGIVCPTGYECSLDGNYPDAGGKCVKK